MPENAYHPKLGKRSSSASLTLTNKMPHSEPLLAANDAIPIPVHEESVLSLQTRLIRSAAGEEIFCFDKSRPQSY